MRTIASFLALLVLSLPLAFASELSLIFDGNGNLVTGDSFYREYNELNQLIRVREGNTSSGQILQEYTWHPVDERILVKRVYEGGVLNQKIIYVNDNFIQIVNSSGIWNETYVYQDGVLVARIDTDGNKLAMHPDHLGSTSLVTDSDGNVVENVFYSPFGEPIEQGASRFGYEGKEFDEQTQDTDFHFRKYRPEWGRFTQPDSLLPNLYNPQSLNRFSFENNNPVASTDPTGHVAPAVAFGAFVLATGLMSAGFEAYNQYKITGDFYSGQRIFGAFVAGVIGGVAELAAISASVGGPVGITFSLSTTAHLTSKSVEGIKESNEAAYDYLAQKEAQQRVLESLRKQPAVISAGQNDCELNPGSKNCILDSEEGNALKTADGLPSSGELAASTTAITQKEDAKDPNTQSDGSAPDTSAGTNQYGGELPYFCAGGSLSFLCT